MKRESPERSGGLFGWLTTHRAPVGAVLVGAAGLAGLSGCATSADYRMADAPSASGRVSLARTSWSVEKQFAHYENIIKAEGGSIQTGRVHVLGLRGMSPNGRVHDTQARGDLSETFVVLERSASGAKSVKHFTGSSYPGQARSSASPDVNGDRVGDVGMITEGRYKATPNGKRLGAWTFHVKTRGGSGRIPGVRDTNHDGRHSAAEWATSKARGHTLGAILFHPTGSNGNVSSIGCMNIKSWDSFVSAIGGKSASFDFTLVNAHHAEAR